ncbi:DNA repair protein [Grosmannia clavigera kw1407]|uniref:Non-structural maintenance of chromosomes element 1 homolog n=1 Tax=Grosmannia clavigera (strain kw1407 / UAMH 11150) TaxID=655863 RepID=F0X8L7_GROCL|nr:DNA repair protein [Grosmannia clavigera kw1407]EFX05409.1 DNA repair protein [Grosmannia clavigera kw1407]
MPKPGRKRTRSQAHGGLDGTGDDDSNSADMTDVRLGDDEGQDNARRQAHWDLPAGYDDRNRAFLQAFMARGALSFKQVQHLLAGIFNAERKRQQNGREEAGDEGLLQADEINLDDMREFVSKAQQALAPLDFDIRSAVDQVRNERLWALVSTDRDPKSHLAVLLTPRKLAFVHRLLAAMFDTYNTPRLEAMCMTEQQALKLSRPPRTTSRASEVGAGDGGGTQAAANRDKGLKHSVVLSLLQSLVRQGWLDKSASGFYAPTTRALLELEPFLVEAFNDEGGGTDAWQRIKYCAACRDVVTIGLRCAQTTCTLRLHDHCETAFWRTQAGAAGGNRTCPRCQTAWTGGSAAADAQSYVGERAITLTDVYKRRKRQGRPSEGVDELMRTVLPRTVPAAVMSFRAGQASQADDGEDDEDEEG